jgi:C4-type Zn-finger protein
MSSIGTKSANVTLSLKDPAGKSFLISSSSIAKNKSYSSPKIKFAKAGSYLATLTIGASKKIVKINVTK